MLAEKSAKILRGQPRPRIAPPLPLRHDLAGYRQVAADMGIAPMPWQDTAAKYLTARTKDTWTFREVAIVVGRQQGKTLLAKPLIMARLRAGRRILHVAQVRQLPAIMFEEIATLIETTYPELLPTRRGKTIWPRRARGDEAIVLVNGGSYRVVAAATGAARGHSVDDLIIDELREMTDTRVRDSAGNTQVMAPDPQTIYLSNAGTDESVILNDLRARAGDDPGLAYLEWSADPEYSADDRRGWVQANPAIGPDRPWVLRELENKFTAASLGGDMAGFETESLCRWVHTMRPVLVTPEEWDACRGDDLPRPVRPSLAVSMDPDRARASVAMAYEVDGMCWLTILEDVAGDPINTSALGQSWRALAQRRRIFGTVAIDPMTDGELAKHFRATKSVSGMEFANATSNFVERVKSGRLRFVDADAVGADLAWTSRKDTGEGGRYQAVRANDERPVTAALAAIRAVWLATGPPRAVPRVY